MQIALDGVYDELRCVDRVVIGEFLWTRNSIKIHVGTDLPLARGRGRRQLCDRVSEGGVKRISIQIDSHNTGGGDALERNRGKREGNTAPKLYETGTTQLFKM